MINIKKFISFLLVFIIILNFTSNNVHAVSVAVPVGTYKLAKFLIACLAVGVGFNALEEAEKLMNEYSKRYASTPPEEPEPDDDKNIIKNILLGLGALQVVEIGSNLMQMLANSVIGKNKYNYLDVIDVVEDGTNIYQEFKLEEGGPAKVIHYRGYNIYFEIEGDGMSIYTSADKIEGVTGWKINKNRKTNVIVDYIRLRDDGRIQVAGYMFISVGGDYKSRFNENLYLPSTTEEIPSGDIEYLVLDENAKILTGDIITEEDIKDVNINPQFIPDEKLEKRIEGNNVKVYYKGNMDELVSDIINNTPYNRLVTDNEIRYVEREDNKVEIIYDDVPEEEPEPETEPENPYDIPENDIRIDWNPLFDINIKDKFPFSLPWDLKRMIEAFRSEREAPVWELPIKGEKIIIDFNTFNEIARIARIMNLLIYVVGLIIVTRRLIQ